jgi:sugar lactone lactonase YvrE
MHPAFSSHSSLPAALGFAALGLLSLGLAAAPARAQTQDLFVSNQFNNTISRFAETGQGTFSTTATTLSDPSRNLNSPQGLAFDKNGDLFAANFGSGTITEFVAGATPGTLGAGKFALNAGRQNAPAGLAFDSRGDLFVGNAHDNSITEFAFTPGAGNTLGTFSAGTVVLRGGGLNYPLGLVFDARGDLFAANGGGTSITEFAFTPGAGATPGTFGTATMLTGGGLAEPNGLAFDASGNLFTSNLLGTTITEFAFNSNTGTFGTGVAAATGLDSPAGLAFDAQGDLFVGSFYGGTITKLAAGATPGTFRTGTVVATDLNGPVFLSFGLLPSAPVPESSTTVSLGLLLALGMGGMVVAARKRRKA